MPDSHDNCEKEAIIHQLIKVQAQVTVTPLVRHGKPKVYCIDADIEPNYCYNDYRKLCQDKKEYIRPDGRCTFTVTQVLCVEIPISIDVDVDMKDGIACCGKPDFGTCVHKDDAE